MKNYICINGYKTELTEEQMKQLGIELPKVNPFERVKYNERYYFISCYGDVHTEKDFDYSSDEDRFNAANYCTDKAIMEQRALHETLNRLLWRYSMEHDGDKIDWSDFDKRKYLICRKLPYDDFEAVYMRFTKYENITYFYTEEAARNAIEEIIKPFMKEHPEFKF